MTGLSDTTDRDRAIEQSVRAYLAAAVLRDYGGLCACFSRGAAAICLAASGAEGGPTDDCAAALEHLAGRGMQPIPIGDDGDLSDLDIQVVTVDADVALVKLTAPNQPEPLTMPWVREDGSWKVGVSGLDDRGRPPESRPARR
jgi:hypothetical protein